MSSLPDDRTAKARIRDEALRLFGERGPDAVTVRDVAAAADVSPALVIRHYGSKDGLQDAVDEHVARVFEVMLAEATAPAGERPFDPEAVPSLVQAVAGHLPSGSSLPGYLGRLLVTGSPAGTALFGKLYAVSRETLASMARAGAASKGADPAVRAAFLLVNDLAVLILHDRLREVLGVDPLSSEGMSRWGTEVFAVYRDGLGDAAADRPDRPSYDDESRSTDV